MKKKKNKLAAIIISAVLVVCLLAGGIVYAFYLPHPLNYPIKDIPTVGSTLQVNGKDTDTVTVTGADDSQFKILMFTDMHLDGKNETSYKTVDMLVKNIVREEPDLVLLGGDNVTSGMNRRRANQLAQIFEKLGVYWAGVLGNHEGDNPYSVTRTEMMDIFTSYEHCLMLKGKDDVVGDCNYTLRILNTDGSLKEAFFFLDTFDMMSDELKAEYGIDPSEKKYDGVKPEQVAWYKEKAQETETEYGAYQSILMLHIPLPQYEEIAAEGNFLYGVNLEGVCCSGFDAGLFDAIKELGVTKAVFCGHDHMNSFGAEKDGILLSYIEPSGYGSYNTGNRLGYEEKDWLQGCTVLKIASDGSFTREQQRNSVVNP